MVDQVLDEGLICHVGFVSAGQPFVIPTIHARLGDVLYIHGSRGSRMLKALKAGAEVCVTVTLLDGLVLARSAFFHSMNYRSAIIVGHASEVTDRDEKWRAFRAIVEHVAPGRWEDCRHPSPKEDRAVSILRVPIEEFSGKTRTGPPQDPLVDRDLPHWAGVIPLHLAPAPAVDSPDLRADLEQPAYIVNYRR